MCDSRHKRYHRQLLKKDEVLQYLLTFNTQYIPLLSHEQKRTEKIMFQCDKLGEYREAIENISPKYRDYLILRSIQRISSEMTELIVLICANRMGYSTRKSPKKSRVSDVIIDKIGWDIKLAFLEKDEEGDYEDRRIREYFQNKIHFTFNKKDKKRIIHNFLPTLRKGQHVICAAICKIANEGGSGINIINLEDIAPI